MVLLTGTKETVIKAIRKHLIHEVSEEKMSKYQTDRKDTL